MADPITEYLVALGFKIDEGQFNRFRDSIKKASIAAGELGLKAIGATTAVAAMIAAIAEKYEDLYFASVKTGESAAALEQFAYGSRAIGISAESSRQSLELFNLAMLANPGRQFLLNYLGIQTAGRTTKQVYDDLIDTLARMPRFLAFAYGGQFGLSASEINERILLRGREAAAESDYARRLEDSGVNMKDLTEKSENFQQAVRGLWTENELLIAQVGEKWLPTMTTAVQKLDEWAQIVVRAGTDTHGWTSTMVALGEAFGVLKGFEFLLRLLGFGTASVVLAGVSSFTAGLGAFLGLSAYGSIKAGEWAEKKFGNVPDYNTPGVGYVPKAEDFKGKTTIWGDKLSPTSFGSNQIPFPDAAQHAVVTSPSGKKFTVSAPFAANFAGFLKDYEEAGGVIGSASGGLASRAGPSKHPWGGSIDVNQTARNVRSGGKTLPTDVENAIAAKWGLYPGSLFSNPDAGHFEVSKELMESVAHGHNPYLPTDQITLSPSVGPSSHISIVQSNTVTANGVPKQEDPPSSPVFSDRFGTWNNSVVRQTKPLLQ